jgi:hypothetical protein
MKILIIPVFLLSFVVILPAVAQDLKPSNKVEKKVVQMIANLPEIVADNKYMTKHGRPYIIYIENTAGDLDNYYHIAVSENNGSQLVPHHRFLVKAKTYQIYYVDFWNDNFKPIPLNIWRKRKASK